MSPGLEASSANAASPCAAAATRDTRRRSEDIFQVCGIPRGSARMICCPLISRSLHQTLSCGDNLMIRTTRGHDVKDCVVPHILSTCTALFAFCSASNLNNIQLVSSPADDGVMAFMARTLHKSPFLHCQRVALRDAALQPAVEGSSLGVSQVLRLAVFPRE